MLNISFIIIYDFLNGDKYEDIGECPIVYFLKHLKTGTYRYLLSA